MRRAAAPSPDDAELIPTTPSTDRADAEALAAVGETKTEEPPVSATPSTDRADAEALAAVGETKTEEPPADANPSANRADAEALAAVGETKTEEPHADAAAAPPAVALAQPETKMCGACGEMMTLSLFSKSQWYKGQRRKCIACVVIEVHERIARTAAAAAAARP